MTAGRLPLGALAVALSTACVDRMLEGGEGLGANADDPADSQPVPTEDDGALESGASGSTDPTTAPAFDPYPDCRPLLPFDQLYDPTTCAAAIGLAHVEAADPEVCDMCMCLRTCERDADCPSPPTRPAADMHCSAFYQNGACLIACSSDEECPPEMVCRDRADYLPDAPAQVCAFAAMRPECCDPYCD